jgi:hypothetical protein
MRKIPFFIAMLFPTCMAFGQKNTNNLLPSELLVEDLCPVYHEFYTGSPWEGRYFSMIDSSNVTLPGILLNLATNPNNRVFSEAESYFYPYDIENQKEIDDDEIFTAFGGETRILKTNEGESPFIENIDTSEVEAVQFIEEWKLDTANDAFTKIVKGLIPVRKYLAYGLDRPMISRTCIIMQHPPVKGTKDRKLIARVKYEVPLIDQNEDVTTCLSNASTNRQELLFRFEMFNSPMLTSYSRNMLVRYLEDKAIQKMEPCYDFKTNLLITDKDTVEKAFGYSYSRISKTNFDGTISDTIIQEKTGYINSLIFCEEWYIDTETGYFSKEVTGIAPVIWNGNTGEKSVSIVLWFDEKKKF